MELSRQSDRVITVKCGKCGEERTCMVRSYFARERCPSCFHLDQSLSYKDVRERGLEYGYVLLTPKLKFNTMKSKYALDPNKDWRKEKLEWKCLDCKQKVSLSFLKVSDVRSDCPSCRMSRHQKGITKYIEATFGVPVQYEKRFGDINLKALGIPVSGSTFNPNLVFDGYLVIHLLDCIEPIPILFEARGYQYYHWPNQYHKGTRQGYLAWMHYHKNADEKDLFAHEHKFVLLSFNDDWDADLVRSELIRQFKLKTKQYGYSKEGITLNPPYYGPNIFSRRFLGSLK